MYTFGVLNEPSDVADGADDSLVKDGEAARGTPGTALDMLCCPIDSYEAVI